MISASRWPGTRRALPGVLTLLASVMPGLAEVAMWEKEVVIPTYVAGPPEPNPMFYFGRASQGAQGRVYPYPLHDSLTDVKSNKTYRVVYIENEHIRVGVLPEIGGRLFEAVDKSNGYDFIYRQHVIKPALIGIIGAWISGGVEWNIPHHHRATTFLPVQHRLEENADGSKTCWVGEMEIRHRMRWAVGYTLRPGKSYLECSIRIINRTPVVNTMLCFANVAVHVDETYQVIYPPRTQLVTFHSKNEFTTWPVATTRYAGIDFTRGVDVSWFSNHIAATSMFAWNYEDDFFAGYNHGKQAGIISFADHHIVPGKKFWTWGSGPRGRMWDKILTDNDGPYIELMVGGYSDNQPDYSWLQPFETKSFEMYWYPFRDIAGVKEANLEAAVNLVVTNARAEIGFCTTARHRDARAVVTAGGRVLLEQSLEISPSKPFTATLALPNGVDEKSVRAALIVAGKELVAYSPLQLTPPKMPERYKAPPSPGDIKSAEELSLAGQRIEQFHAPGREPDPYWEEALRRDPEDTRANLSMGIRRLKQARYPAAEQYLRTALARTTGNHTTPRGGEAFYYLGMALEGQGKTKEAVDALSKATWSHAWISAAYFALAEIASREGQSERALNAVNRSLEANALNLRAATLKAALLRNNGKSKQARAELEAAAAMVDPLEVRIMAERWLGSGKGERELAATIRAFPSTGLETAAEFARAGMYKDADAILSLMSRSEEKRSGVIPLVHYYRGWLAELRGDTAKARQYREQARSADPEYVFPFQPEAIAPLRSAIAADPGDARAAYYLGNLLFDWQPKEAIELWKKSAASDPSFAIVHRNLAVAEAERQGKTGDVSQAIALLERAVSLPRKYAMHFTELDELYARTGADPAKRLALLEQNHDVVSTRDDALSREIGLKVFAGKLDDAIALMKQRTFRVWEGGSLDVADHWVDAHILRGQQRLADRRLEDALNDFHAARTIPDNLPSDTRQGGEREAELLYWIGCTQDAQGRPTDARASWQKAASLAPDKSGQTMIIERAVQAYYSAMASEKLGNAAGEKFQELIDAAERTLNSGSPSEPNSRRSRRNLAGRVSLAHYIAGLGHLGLGHKEKAHAGFTLALKAQPDLLGAKLSLESLNR